ncbi:MAG: quinone-dependent dihydroorotate dehydrogenase [Pseudomonadota bacterium]|nr:quinone-dependent dihydroorotate dehydrogenase [Pseudomonadota bacterium]
MNYKFFSKFSNFLPPEFLHKLFLRSLKLELFQNKKEFENLKTRVFGKEFENPLGLAAGFDKNAEVIRGSINLGFGFLELGTVTPMPQYGNSKPRVFKIPEYKAVIQRLGFNNCGVELFLENIRKYRRKNNNIIGINIGKNKNSEDFLDDYKFLYETLEPYADYITINISSPNTPGLRDIQEKGKIEIFLNKLSKIKNRKPTFLKLSPDISDKDLCNICKIITNEDFVNGLILTNTTVSRDMMLSKPVRNSWKIYEEGGLSGPPLRNISNELIRKVFELTNGKIIIIGVGGVSSGKDAFEKISLGASLIQLYTSLIYQGPDVVSKILSELSLLLKKKGLKSVKELIGKDLSYD